MSVLGLVVSKLFGSVWELYQTPVPGFPFSYADIFIGIPLAFVGLKLTSAFMGQSGAVSSGKSTQNPKISDERMNDTK